MCVQIKTVLQLHTNVDTQQLLLSGVIALSSKLEWHLAAYIVSLQTIIIQ